MAKSRERELLGIVSPFVHLAFLPLLNQLDQEMVVKFHPALT